MTEDTDDDYVLVADPEDSEKDDLTKRRRFAFAIAEASKSISGGLVAGTVIAVFTESFDGVYSPEVRGGHL